MEPVESTRIGKMRVCRRTKEVETGGVLDVRVSSPRLNEVGQHLGLPVHLPYRIRKHAPRQTHELNRCDVLTSTQCSVVLPRSSLPKVISDMCKSSCRCGRPGCCKRQNAGSAWHEASVKRAGGSRVGVSCVFTRRTCGPRSKHPSCHAGALCVPRTRVRISASDLSRRNTVSLCICLLGAGVTAAKMQK